MIKGILVGSAFLLGLLSPCSTLFAQEGPPSWTPQGILGLSAFRYGRARGRHWKPAAKMGVRVIVRERVHFDLSYVAPGNDRWEGSNIPEPLPSATSEGHGGGGEENIESLGLLSASMGLRGTFREWRPYLGVGRGWFWRSGDHGQGSEQPPAWFILLGGERYWKAPYGIVVEGRVVRVEWEDGANPWNAEVGVGLSIRAW